MRGEKKRRATGTLGKKKMSHKFNKSGKKKRKVKEGKNSATNEGRIQMKKDTYRQLFVLHWELKRLRRNVPVLNKELIEKDPDYVLSLLHGYLSGNFWSIPTDDWKPEDVTNYYFPKHLFRKSVSKVS